MAERCASLRERLERGRRLTRQDAVHLYRDVDLDTVRAFADRAARQRNGRRVTYVVNRHINYTNLCVGTCLFCAFSRRSGDPEAFAYSLPEILDRARSAAAAGATELHIVGGLHPELPFSFYPAMLRALRAEFPGLSLKAFTAVELDHFTRLSGLELPEVVRELAAAGLDFVPGGGAEVLSDRVWRRLFPEKTPPSRWLEIHREVHRQGLRSNATLLFGHIETVEEKVDHLLRLRGLQDETGGFVSYVPLRFHPRHTCLGRKRIVGRDAILREIAVGRLVLDNFRHVKAYWVMTGLQTALLALSGGADDFDGTVVEERIGHMAGAETPEGLTEEQIRRLIEAEGLEPHRR